MPITINSKKMAIGSKECPNIKIVTLIYNIMVLKLIMIITILIWIVMIIQLIKINNQIQIKITIVIAILLLRMGIVTVIIIMREIIRIQLRLSINPNLINLPNQKLIRKLIRIRTKQPNPNLKTRNQ